MGACPKHRVSKMNQRKRRTHDKLEVVSMTKCPQCFEMKRSHTVCSACGYYNKRTKVLDIEKAA